MSETTPREAVGRPETDPGYSISEFDPARHSAAEIARLHLAIRQKQQADGENSYYNITDSQTDLTNIDGYYLHPGGQFLVATGPGGQIAGFVGLKKTDRGGELKRLAVVPDHRRAGLGDRLVGHAVYWATLRGWPQLSLATGYGERAKPIYLRHGFLVVGRNEASRDFLMELKLQA